MNITLVHIQYDIAYYWNISLIELIINTWLSCNGSSCILFCIPSDKAFFEMIIKKRNFLLRYTNLVFVVGTTSVGKQTNSNFCFQLQGIILHLKNVDTFLTDLSNQRNMVSCFLSQKFVMIRRLQIKMLFKVWYDL